jgi:hypothetical protein
LLYFVTKKLSSVFVRFFRAPLHWILIVVASVKKVGGSSLYYRGLH